MTQMMRKVLLVLRRDKMRSRAIMMARATSKDETLTEGKQERARKIDRAVDEWIVRYVEGQYSMVTEESKQLVSTTCFSRTNG